MVVWGSVRDILIGEKPEDYDFVVTGMGLEEFRNILCENNFENFLISSRKQVQGVKTNGINCEFACCKGRRDLLEYINQLDYTCNSILLDLETGNIVDILGGYKDIKQRRIRSILPPKEYPTNILRAAYVAMKTGFDFEKETLKAIRDCTDLAFCETYKLKSTRILGNILESPKCEEGMEALLKLGVLEKEFPNLYNKMKNGTINFREIEYINAHVKQDDKTKTAINYKLILLFLNMFGDETQENLDKLYFYNEYNAHTTKILKLASYYNKFFGQLTLEDIERLLQEQNIKPKYRRAVIALISNLSTIKGKCNQNRDIHEDDITI